MGLLLACSTAKTQTRLLLIRKVILIAVYLLLCRVVCVVVMFLVFFVCENCDLILSQIWHTSFSIFVALLLVIIITLCPLIHTCSSVTFQHQSYYIYPIQHCIYCANCNENLIDWKSTCTVGAGHDGEHLLFRVAPLRT